MGFLDSMFQSKPQEFVMGVQDKFGQEGTRDLVVVGKVAGTVRKGDAVYVSNFGDDSGEVLVSMVLGIESSADQPANSITDSRAALKIAGAAGTGVKCGTVVYTREASIAKVHDAYVRALADVFARDPESFFQADASAALSITDCAELLGFSNRQLAENKVTDETMKQYLHGFSNRMAHMLASRVQQASGIWCVFSRRTGEPYLFAHIEEQGSDYRCTSPTVTLLSKPYHEILARRYPPEQFEVREISAGENGKGVLDFLGDTIYLDGANCVSVNAPAAVLPAGILVAPPDFSKVPEISRPVMNPDLERWLLLMAQLGKPETEEQQQTYKVYFSFLERALVSAKLLVPMKHEGEIAPPDAQGRTVLPDDLKISLATMTGKNGRSAVRMFTDWKRLKAGMGEGWEGMIQTVGGLIAQFDCALNYTKDPNSGCYISKELYEAMPQPDAGPSKS